MSLVAVEPAAYELQSSGLRHIDMHIQCAEHTFVMYVRGTS